MYIALFIAISVVLVLATDIMWQRNPERLRRILFLAGLVLAGGGALYATVAVAAGSWYSPLQVAAQLQRLGDIVFGLGVAFLGVGVSRLSQIVRRGQRSAQALRGRTEMPVTRSEQPAA